MSKLLSEVLASNRLYAASFGDKGKLALPPARRFAILTCMCKAPPRLGRLPDRVPFRYHGANP